MGGYDTRVDFKGDAYIVQTQDKGPGAQYVESLIYKSGRLLAIRRGPSTRPSSARPTSRTGSNG
ncbi:MAG: hypothetical protein MZU95_12945 [Desulfomicrobium escambiense]|nr:hypothetical protein [Desulfomicrobium escambiense]